MWHKFVFDSTTQTRATLSYTRPLCLIGLECARFTCLRCCETFVFDSRWRWCSVKQLHVHNKGNNWIQTPCVVILSLQVEDIPHDMESNKTVTCQEEWEPAKERQRFDHLCPFGFGLLPQMRYYWWALCVHIVWFAVIDSNVALTEAPSCITWKCKAIADRNMCGAASFFVKLRLVIQFCVIWYYPCHWLPSMLYLYIVGLKLRANQTVRKFMTMSETHYLPLALRTEQRNFNVILGDPRDVNRNSVV